MAGEILGVETVNGTNQLAWKNTNGSYYRWTLSQNWNPFSGQSITLKPNSHTQ